MNLEQAFTGIKVLAVARVVAAPFAAYQLAMHGANVIRIEHPELGDSARTSGYPPTPFQQAKMGHNFVAYNANTRSVSLYINTPAGQVARAGRAGQTARARRAGEAGQAGAVGRARRPTRHTGGG